MRVMVIVKANKESEAGVMPDTKMLTDMGKYNEQLANAGIMLAGEGLHPTSKGKRVRFSGNERRVIDGPFAETKELIAGYRSEEHTSELQSQSNLVCRLLLEKKNIKYHTYTS